LKRILKKCKGRSGLGLERLKGFCENGNETSVYVKRGDFSTKETSDAERNFVLH